MDVYNNNGSMANDNVDGLEMDDKSNSNVYAVVDEEAHTDNTTDDGNHKNVVYPHSGSSENAYIHTDDTMNDDNLNEEKTRISSSRVSTSSKTFRIFISVFVLVNFAATVTLFVLYMTIPAPGSSGKTQTSTTSGITTGDWSEIAALIMNNQDFIDECASAVETDLKADAAFLESVKGQDGVDAQGFRYPIGAIYLNADDDRNPSVVLGYGTWERFAQGRTLVSLIQTGSSGLTDVDVDFGTIGQEGGERVHALTLDEMPSHTHKYSEASNGPAALGVGVGYSPATAVGRQVANTQATGNGDAHNLLQPYIVVHMWKRTA